MQPLHKIVGIAEFSEAIYCAEDALGHTVSISISGQKGTLTLPLLPSLPEASEDFSTKEEDLLAPSAATGWARAEVPIEWGHYSHWTRCSMVEKAVVEFSAEPSDSTTTVQELYAGFHSWLSLFEQYVTLLTTQNTWKRVSSDLGPGRLELYWANETGIELAQDVSGQTIHVTETQEDVSLHKGQLEVAATHSSNGLRPRQPYRLLLEAYRANRNGEYRNAIVEAATALEFALTERIIEEFESLNLSFGEQLLKKFRMLGGRLELCNLLGIELPEQDIRALISGPRNDVVHRASYANISIAHSVITEVKELLGILTPQIQEDVDQ